MEGHEVPKLQGDALKQPPALECGDLSPLSPSGGFVRRTAPRGKVATHAFDGDKSPHSKIPWPHAPVHKLDDNAVYFVTAGTLHKERFFTDKTRLDLVERKLMELANQYHWQLEAWAVFPNHYHIVARGFPNSASLGKFLKHLHSDTARELNRMEGKEGQKVWFNFRETKLTFEKSYLARLNYVHQNAVHHHLVLVANQYPWCSAAWFERVSTPAMVQTIYSFKTDQVKVDDDF